MKGLIKGLFWWLFLVFAIGQISAIFHVWVVGVIAAVAYIGVILALVMPTKDKDDGVLAVFVILFICAFVFLFLADVAAFMNLGSLQGTCFMIITSVGAGCLAYDFGRFLDDK